MKAVSVILLSIFLSACASSSGGGKSQTWKMPTNDENPNANPSADSYGSDGFTFSKDQPHRDNQNWEFYYKHCSMNGNESYFSATSYDCTGPSW